jgi:hypothetical protein
MLKFLHLAKSINMEIFTALFLIITLMILLTKIIFIHYKPIQMEKMIMIMIKVLDIAYLMVNFHLFIYI